MAGQSVASYRVHAGDNPFGAHAVATNTAMLNLVFGVVARRDVLAEDLHSLALTLAAQSGGVYSAYQLEYMLGWGVRVCQHLPLFRAHALEIGVVGVRHIMAMEQVFQFLDNPLEASLWSRLDAALVQKFTPTVADQQVPSARNVKRWLEEQLRTWLIAQAEEEPEITESVTCIPLPNKGVTVLSAELPDADAAAVHACLERHAAAEKTSLSQALVQLVCQQSEGIDAVRKVVLFGLGEQKPNTILEAAYLQGIGPLSASQRKLLSAANLEYQDALAVAQEISAGHEATASLRKLVMLRDGTCRFPGCAHDAIHCDIDHVINHQAGGWTTLSNLQCLCRRHHNAKTDRRVRATMRIDGAVTWHHADGTLIATTVPTGQLAGVLGIRKGINTRHSDKTPADDNTSPPKNNGIGRWGYTLAQKHERIRKRVQLRSEEPPPDEDEDDDCPLADGDVFL